MSRLEELIGETLVEHESEAPSGANLLADVHARRRRRHPRAAVVAASVFAAAGVAAVVGILTQVPPSDSDAPAYRLPVARASTPEVFPLPSDGWRPGAPALDALTMGPFHAARLEDGQVCAWLGNSFRPTLWPQGYRVRLHPVQLLGPHGRVIAEAGDVLSAGGGGNPAAAGTPCAEAGQWTWSVMSVPRLAQEAHPAGRMGTLVGHLYLVGGPVPGGRRGVSGTVTVHGSNGNSTVKTGHDGAFSIELPPGSYTLDGRSRQYNKGAGACTAQHSVTVKRARTVSIDVFCQMR